MDVNELAKKMVEKSTEKDDKLAREKNPAAAALGRLGGIKGGPARAVKMSVERRSEIARKAALARWKAEQ